MTGATARKELAAARAAGKCDWCGAVAKPGQLYSTRHKPGCKVVNDAGIRRR